jgi:hypothetical protein
MTKIAKTALIIAIVGVGLWWACVIGKERQQKQNHFQAHELADVLDEWTASGVSTNDREFMYVRQWMAKNGVSYDGPR